MPDIIQTIQIVRKIGAVTKIVPLLFAPLLFAFILITPVSASQRMVLAEGYTNYQ